MTTIEELKVQIEALRSTLVKIATVYDWHPKIPDDGYVGEADALEQIIELAEKALK